MIYYVSGECSNDALSIQTAKRTMEYLQRGDFGNCYISPVLNFSHLGLEPSIEKELRLDLLSVSDCLIMFGEITDIIKSEIDFARLVKMEVMRLDEHGDLQPFTE